MATVAAERDIVSTSDAQRVDDRSAAEQEVTPEADRPWHERLVLRYLTWDTQHPHSLYLRLQHKLATTYYRLGLGRFDDGMVVTTTGRTSGLPRHVVLGANLIDGHPYVMNPFGERAHWYRNLLADPIITVQQRGRTWTARATRVTEHDEAIALYEKIPGSTGTAMRWLLRVQGIAETAEAFAEHIDQVHFVRFDPVDELGPPPMAVDLAWVWPVAGAAGAVALLARRRLKVAFATAALSAPTLVGAALAGGRVDERMTDSGMRLEGRWAHLWHRVWPRFMWWLYDDFAEALELQPDDDVLDVACGCGTFLRTRCAKAHAIAGLDHSTTFIDIARQESQDRVELGTAEFRVGDVAELPWADDTFSVVTSNDVDCYEDKSSPAIAEMYRVLRRGGRAVLSEDRRKQMEAAGFVEVTVEPLRRFGFITKGIKR